MIPSLRTGERNHRTKPKDGPPGGDAALFLQKCPPEFRGRSIEGRPTTAHEVGSGQEFRRTSSVLRMIFGRSYGGQRLTAVRRRPGYLSGYEHMGQRVRVMLSPAVISPMTCPVTPRSESAPRKPPTFCAGSETSRPPLVWGSKTGSASSSETPSSRT